MKLHFINLRKENNYVDTEVFFSVNQGTYTIVLYGTVGSPGTIEDVYLNLIGLPQTNTKGYSSNVPTINQKTRPFLNKPLSDK